MRSSRWTPAHGCSSLTRTHRGSGRRTRTRTGCCGSTSPRAPTCRAGPPKTSRPSRMRSTTDPERSSAGRRPSKSSRSNYARFDKLVLRPPVELAEYTARSFQAACGRVGVTQSMGRVGSALDNAVIESWHSTVEFELRQLEHFTTKPQARRRVAAWIEEYNHHRRHSSLQMRSPIAYELALAAREQEQEPAA